MVWKYFPCVPGGKEPALKGDWRSHATDDKDQIQAWLDAGYNLAIDCEASGLCVIDLDGGEIGEATWQRLQAEHGDMGETYTVKTPRGGRHLYYQGRAASSVQTLGAKCDTRSEGGYVVCQPSVVGVAAYETLSNAPLATLPSWVPHALEKIRSVAPANAEAGIDTPTNVARATLWLQSRAPAIEGAGGDHWTYQTACGVLDLGISADLAAELMLEHWNPRCEPPWDAEALEIKITNASEYMQNEPGAWAVGDPVTRFAGVAENAAANLRTFHIHSEADQDAWQDPTWLVPHALPDDSLVMIYGAKGSFKSFIALDLGLHIASARPGWGTTFNERRAVVYCAGEGPTSVGKFRRPAWRLTYPDVEGKLPFYLIKDREFPKAASEEKLRNFIEGVRHLKPALVIIDTLHVFMTGLSEVKDDDCGIAIEALKQIKRELGCIVLVIHHAGKDVGQGARGHSSLTADMDVVHETIGHPATKALTLWNRYQKDADERQQPWCFEGRPSGRSLVFHPISEAEHKALTAGTSELSDRQLGPVLAQAGAKGHDKAITSHALASLLYQGASDETPEATIANRERLARQLAARAKHSVYAERVSHGWVWSVPA